MENSHGRNWIMARKLKTWKMRHTQCRACNMARNSEKCEKGEMYTVRPGLWQDI